MHLMIFLILPRAVHVTVVGPIGILLELKATENGSQKSALIFSPLSVFDSTDAPTKATQSLTDSATTLMNAPSSSTTAKLTKSAPTQMAATNAPATAATKRMKVETVLTLTNAPNPTMAFSHALTLAPASTTTAASSATASLNVQTAFSDSIGQTKETFTTQKNTAKVSE